MPPKVSVIIPTYNHAHYLPEAVQSVLAQTFQDFEVFVVDDGSKDHTREVIKRFEDARIQYIYQTNQGLSAARNTGLHQSSAPFVTFLDADDFFLADKLEVLLKSFERHSGFGLVVGRVRYIDHNGKTIIEQAQAPRKLVLPDLLVSNPICVSGILMKHLWLKRVGGFDETLNACEDWDMWLRLLAAGCQMSWVDHPVVAYRVHQGQMTRQSDRMRNAMLSMLDKFFSQSEIPEYLESYKKIAYASALIKASAYAYHSNELEKGQIDLVESLRLDPTLKDNNYSQVVDLLVGWSNDPQSTHPVDFLQRIISNPPPGHPGLVRQLRRKVADALLNPYFAQHQESAPMQRRDLLRVIRYKPDWLLNRGVLRMLADSLLRF